MAQYKEEYNICPQCGFYEGARAEEAMHMDPGTIIADRYIVGRVVGFGGFGVTYIGWDAKLERKIAVKEYLPGEFSTRVPGHTQITVFSDSTKVDQFNTGMKKFIDEARSLAQFQNEDGIVKVYDTFEENNTAYIIMEFLEGETLTERLKRDETIPAEEAIEMLLPIVKSLQTIHASGIIHRDIAPDNIHLGANGKNKLIDFGAARYATTNHSRSLTVIIKPGFSPEEQYRSRGDQGPHTDVYAIGAVLYRVITGKTPPDAMERRAMFEKHGKDILAPIEKLAKEIPDNRAIAVTNALNVRIENRTPDMAELENELTTDEPVVRRAGKIKKIDILRAPLPVKIGVAAAACVIVTLSALLATGILGPNTEDQLRMREGLTAVPSVINLYEEIAKERVTGKELLFAVAGKEFSTNIQADRILTQDLSAASYVPVNSVLGVSISAGAEKKYLDEYRGEDVDSVRLELEDQGFAVRITQEYSNIYAPDAVIWQTPEAGEYLVVGEAVDLRISMGPEIPFSRTPVNAPDLEGMQYDNAKDTLEQSRLLFRVTRREFSDDIPVGQVMSQNSSANTNKLAGDIVGVVLSKGPFVAIMPDVQYKHIDEAALLLQAQRLTFTETQEESETVLAWHIISQSVEPLTRLPEGTSVKLVVSIGGKPTEVPDVAEGNPALIDAREILIAAGFAVSVTYEQSQAVQEGRVISQDISPGSMLRRGEVITLIVSSGREGQTAMLPNVVNMTRENARAALESAGFRVSITEVDSATVAQGHVISQNPLGGTTQIAGATVRLNVSRGGGGVSVPDVTGQSQSMAERMLQEAGLAVSVVAVYSGEENKDRVTTQSPRAGTSARRGDTVTITVNLGASNNQMPNLVGQSRAMAESALGAIRLNLSINMTEAFSDTIPEGSVVSQEPRAGAPLTDGTSVQLVISRGGSPTSIPNIVGMSDSAARARLHEAGLRAGSVSQSHSDTVEIGNVISQSPGAGMSVKKGDAVDFTVSLGSEQLTVPNLMGHQLASAKSQNPDFNVVESAQGFHDTILEGSIISQSPPAGSRAAKGTTINVTVSKGREPVEVPEVIGQTQFAADSALRARGFVVTVEEATSMTVPRGSVISQVPVGKLMAPRGSTVRITVSSGKPQVTVPNVVGATEAGASSTIQSALLSVTVANANSESVPNGQVISQTPTGGSTVDQGSTVTITVSRGRAEATVPDVINQPISNARTTLTGEGLTVTERREHHDSIGTDRVISTNPPAGSTVARGTSVEIVVSLGKQQVPRVLGLTQEAAQKALSDEGFTYRITHVDTLEYSNSVPKDSLISGGTVTIQDPAANSTTWGSRTVQITVPRTLSLGPEQRVDSVTVTPLSGNSVNAGGQLSFSATVHGTGNPPQSVTWSVLGNSSSGTTINNGVLSVSSAETSQSLTVRATSTLGSVTGTANVTVTAATTVESVSITPPGGHVNAGNQLFFSATVHGTGSPSQSVTWSVSGGSSGTQISGGTLTVSHTETSPWLTVRATSTADPSRFGEVTVSVNPYVPPGGDEDGL